MRLSDAQRSAIDELEGVKRLSQYGVGQALALQHVLQRGQRDQQDDADLERVQRVLERRGVMTP